MEELSQLAKSFKFESEIYEIKVFKTIEEDKYVVQAFLKGKPANGYSYSVKQSVKFDFMRAFGESAISNLIDHAESDIKNKTWEKYLKAVQRSRSS